MSFLEDPIISSHKHKDDLNNYFNLVFTTTNSIRTMENNIYSHKEDEKHIFAKEKNDNVLKLIYRALCHYIYATFST